MRESLMLSRELGNKWVVPYAMEVIADICAKENDPAKAAQLYGAALAQREALGLVFSVLDGARYHRALDRLHEQVSNEIFDREWEKGRSLGLQAAIELAMETEGPKRQPVRRKR